MMYQLSNDIVFELDELQSITRERFSTSSFECLYELYLIFKNGTQISSAYYDHDKSKDKIDEILHLKKFGYGVS